jgi:hypothetical protein
VDFGVGWVGLLSSKLSTKVMLWDGRFADSDGWARLYYSACCRHLVSLAGCGCGEKGEADVEYRTFGIIRLTRVGRV